MRDEFPEFYTPSKEQFDQIWKNCTFSFDANALLNVYSFSHTTLDVFMSLLQQFNDRLWLPHQAAYEYHKNQHTRIADQLKTPDFFAKIQEAHNLVRKKHHPFIDFSQISEMIEQITHPIAQGRNPEVLEAYAKRCDESKRLVANLFKQKIGPPYPADKLELKRKEADKRYKAVIPPGFMDWKKKSDELDKELKNPSGKFLPDPFGDVIIWFQLLDYAEKEKKPIIFVTDDAKDDWWWNQSGRTIGPRPELIAEMNALGVDFYMYNSTNFIKFGSDYVKNPPTPDDLAKAIEESKDVAASNEIARLWSDNYPLMCISHQNGQSFHCTAATVSPKMATLSLGAANANTARSGMR